MTVPVTFTWQHHDRVGERLEGKGKIRTGTAARLHPQGDPLRYPWGVEYRDMEGLRQIAEQLPGKPFVSPHPDGMIAAGAKANVIGVVRRASVEGNRVLVECEVTPEGQSYIDRGAHELSVGYNAHLDGNRFQRNIQVDHLAAVELGRCGPECRLDHAHIGDQQVLSGASGSCSCGCGGGCVASSMPTATVNVPVTEHSDKTLTAADRHAIPAKHYAVPSREALPIEDEGHVKAAMARFNQEEFKSPAERRSAYHRIMARAHELGIDAKGFAKKHGAHADDDDGADTGSNMDSTSSDDAHADNAPGGGKGIAQNAIDTGMAAPDIHAKLAGLQAELKSMTAKYDEMSSKYDAEKSAHGITMASQLQAEKDRDAGKLDAYNARKDLEAEKTRADRAERERDEHKDRADKAEKAMREAQEKGRLDADVEFQTRVQAASSARAELLASADRILGRFDDKGEPVDRSKMSDHDLKVAVIQHVDHYDGVPEANLVDGMYVGAVRRAAYVAKSAADVRQTLHENRMSGASAPIGGLDAERAAQAEMTNRTGTAWQPKN